jgi:hypothetical protein
LLYKVSLVVAEHRLARSSLRLAETFVKRSPGKVGVLFFAACPPAERYFRLTLTPLHIIALALAAVKFPVKSEFITRDAPPRFGYTNSLPKLTAGQAGTTAAATKLGLPADAVDGERDKQAIAQEVA